MPENDSTPATPVVLELAPLPREQSGPFVLLGVGKSADRDQIEANWAQRVIWARKKKYSVPLEDINWAREVLSDTERRFLADSSSLNVDVVEGTLSQLESRFGGTEEGKTEIQPIDEEKQLQDYSPDVEVPEFSEIEAMIKVPEIPREFPMVAELLKQFAQEPIDPWSLEGFSTDE